MTSKRRSVFACQEIAAGEVVERSPVVPCPQIRPPRSARRCWASTSSGGATTIHCASCWGLGAYSTTATMPNTEYTRDYAGSEMIFTALRPISTGDELTINFNGFIDCQDPVWFDVLD